VNWQNARQYAPKENHLRPIFKETIRVQNWLSGQDSGGNVLKLMDLTEIARVDVTFGSGMIELSYLDRNVNMD
jgi:hypothetical protein